jgi:hypothetical protein
MSAENVQQVIGRAILESEFRALLFSDPDKALEGYDLTGEETAALKTLDEDKFGDIASQLDERISKSGLGIIFLRIRRS